MLKEYIFISDGYRGGANTFMNNHMEYLINKKQKFFYTIKIQILLLKN